MGLLNENTGNYYPQVDGSVGNMDSLWERYVAQPVINWFNFKIQNIGEWLKINVIDIIGIVAIVIIATTALRMFFFKKDKDYPTIYYTIVIYSIIKLFWKVVLHA